MAAKNCRALRFVPSWCIEPRNCVFNSALFVTLSLMHALQTLDIGLFHFINRSLSNPFFDWLMPVLSGHGVGWFVPLAVLFGVAVLCFGNTRARLCAFMAI